MFLFDFDGNHLKQCFSEFDLMHCPHDHIACVLYSNEYNVYLPQPMRRWSTVLALNSGMGNTYYTRYEWITSSTAVFHISFIYLFTKSGGPVRST